MENVTNIPTSKLICRHFSTWFALKLYREGFEGNTLESMLARYAKLVKIHNKDTETALSDKQYAILKNVYQKFKIREYFDFKKLKFNCFNMSEFGDLVVKSASGVECKDYFFEVLDEGILTKEEFKEKYGGLILKRIAVLSPSKESDFD